MSNPTNLDHQQIMQTVYDIPTNSLRVVSNIVAVSGQQQIAISSTEDSVAIGDTSGNLVSVVNNALKVDGSAVTQTVTGVKGTLTDRSGSITLGGTSQQVAAANASRQYLLFQNISDTDMWINFAIAAVADSPSIYIAAKSGITFETNFIPTGALNVICATTGKKYTAKEG